ncbi:ATP-binding cassette domain-containing protein [Streptomyces sp. NPDC059851]|uniref:ATP-binding cassette domain-containing protein n=1 Tax=Streptomyces sp. NPDC059851 TaxID=3346971 RepID=UPI00365446B6
MKLTGVGRRHGPRRPWVLRGVSLELAPGTLVRIEGRNGGGKSTLMRIIAGIDAPTEGRVRGRPRRTAFVPERFPAALPLTAAAYLSHMGRVHGLPRAEAERRAAYWLERFGAGAHARTPLAELSKGSSQKVAVAQALLAEPGLLVLDEAWTGLDASARAELDGAVAERTAAGGAVVFVDHDPARLADAADARHRVEGTGLVPVPEPEGGRTGPWVRIRAAGPAGAVPPLGLDTAPLAPDGGLLVTVPAARSDAVLRALLTATPPWHVRGVEELP